MTMIFKAFDYPSRRICLGRIRALQPEPAPIIRVALFERLWGSESLVTAVPKIGAALSALLVAPAFATSATPASEPMVRITLAPGKPDLDQHIPYVDVTITASGIARSAGEPLLRLPLVANTVVTSGGRLTGITIRDRRGAFTPHVEDVEKDSSNRVRYWRAPRAVDGTLTLRYRVPIDADAAPLALPQYEMRTELGSFSAAGTAFLILPDDDTPRRASVTWDFTAYGVKGEGVSSLGIGNAESRSRLRSDKLASMYFMAGRPGIYSSTGDGFFAAWQGAPPFPMIPLMEWASDLHRYYGTFFGYLPAGFGVFTRTNSVNPGSGIGLTDSFAFTFNERSRPDGLRHLLAHEMLHAWVNSLDSAAGGTRGLDGSWFAEGLAVHYQRLLPYRAGSISADDFLADLNKTAARYYTNSMIRVPNGDVPAGFWRDTRIRVLPYDRGSLYFAATDAAIRKVSNGKRSLDDIVRTMLAERRAGRSMDEALYRRLLRTELGDEGIAALETMLAGGIVLPPSDAFGPQFRRVEKPLRRFELGFDPSSLLKQPKIVRGLIDGSNAQKAGLRNGDQILNTFTQDSLQQDQQGVLSLEVKRGGELLRLAYQPRGETVSAHQWEAAR